MCILRFDLYVYIIICFLRKMCSVQIPLINIQLKVFPHNLIDVVHIMKQ